MSPSLQQANIPRHTTTINGDHNWQLQRRRPNLDALGGVGARAADWDVAAGGRRPPQPAGPVLLPGGNAKQCKHAFGLISLASDIGHSTIFG
jgi:hypothetical protein